ARRVQPSFMRRAGRRARSAAELLVAGLAVLADRVERGLQAGAVHRRRGARAIERGAERGGVAAEAGVLGQPGEGRVEVVAKRAQGLEVRERVHGAAAVGVELLAQ